MSFHTDVFSGCGSGSQGSSTNDNLARIAGSADTKQGRLTAYREQQPLATNEAREMGGMIMVTPAKSGKMTELEVSHEEPADSVLTPTPSLRETEHFDAENLHCTVLCDRQHAAAHLNYNGGAKGSSVLRNVEVREMLVYVERELAESREEAARQSAEIDSLRAALAQEQETNRRARSNFEEAMQELREDNAEHIQGLMEQIAVLKRLSESVLEEKTRITEEAIQRKQQLLALLERERKEKSEIMENYRQQTESLIAEQGREITSLRAMVHSTREDYEQQLTCRQELEDKLQQQQERLADAEAVLEKERAAASQRQQEFKQRYLRRIEELTSQNEELTIRMEKDAAKLQEWRREALDHERGLAERLREQEERHAKEQETIKESYVQELTKLQEEIQEARKQRDEAEQQVKEGRQRTLKGEEKTIQALNQAVEQLRQEKEAMSEETARQCEELRDLHNVKVSQLQSVIDTLRRQHADENTARVNAEAERDLVTIRAEGLQTTATRLATEMEAFRTECRARERAAAQERQNSQELLRAQLRECTAEVEDLKQRLLQRDLEEQRLRDEIALKAQALQNLRTENKRLLEEAKHADDKREREVTECQISLEKNTAALYLQKTQAEAECQRLQHALEEIEARYKACERRLDDERQALKETAEKLQESRDAAEESKVAHRRTQTRRQELEEELQRKNSELAAVGERITELEEALEASEADARQHAKEAAEMAKEHERQLHTQKQQHEEEALALRREAEKLHNDATKVHEAAALKDSELHRLREEVNQLRREADTSMGSLRDQLAEEKLLREDDLHRLDDVLNTLRADLSRAQKAKAQCLKDMAQTQRDAERQRLQLQEMLGQTEAAKERLQEEGRHREQLNSELQGTVRLLSSRLATYEDDNRRMQEELTDLSSKLHDTHTLIGRKDAAIGQLTARLRAYEARLGVSAT
ncbi:uncharacterized protein TEOVI_000696800 [Trypanosoma equiperdum]|uniref:Uncharacterized protein n=2 Tax=Trypanozoon TaxID=39700 RepID=Q57UL2_TRYB2|nr:hypothetical protein, conserved [Trypanosoma brucei brucei TREU927]AAX70707.1 hypothetical protein, conserved [Trypanosoma brucei]AAZ13304.1 hypothetical protein, conserved [Trypanosoma brucei brucei TREU927]SCU66988.1 hypothetical protein, conserved [Trypanosoma equiperdum]